MIEKKRKATKNNQMCLTFGQAFANQTMEFVASLRVIQIYTRI